MCKTAAANRWRSWWACVEAAAPAATAGEPNPGNTAAAAAADAAAARRGAENAMTPRTVLAYPPLGDRRPAVEGAGPVRVLEAAAEEEAVSRVGDADALIGRVTPPILAAAAALRWVQCPTASLEHYVFPELCEHPATLTNAAGLFGDVVAEHVLGWMLSFNRNLHHYRDRQRRGEWSQVGGGDDRPEFLAGPAAATGVDRSHRRMAETRTLVVGFGSIGRAVAERVRSLGGAVEGVDPVSPQPGFEVRPVEDLSWRLGTADFVVLAAPETPATRGLFDAKRIARMRPDAVLMNVGRGPLVDTDALAAALRRERIAGAALDVVTPEPLPTDHPLWRMPNVLITPHVAASSLVISERHLELLCDNVRRFCAGEPLRNVVDLSGWRRP